MTNPRCKGSPAGRSAWKLSLAVALAAAAIFFGPGLGALFKSGSGAAHAQSFAIPRYIPTTAGEWGFGVDHPWYSSTRHFAAGFTFDYAHNPLLAGVRDQNGNFQSGISIIEHQLLLHFDIAVSLLDRVTLSASLPLIIKETGQTFNFAGTSVGPMSGTAVGDPRFGLMFRAVGQADEDAFSLHLGGLVWVPVGDLNHRAADREVRVMPKLVLAGMADPIRWSLSFGYLWREQARLAGFPAALGTSVGPELHIGALLQYASSERTFAIGPEVWFATTAKSGQAFKEDFSSLDVLLGIQVNVAREMQMGIAGGPGFLRQPGNPDFRALFRLAYAPLPEPDTDGDGIGNDDDACPTQIGIRSRNRSKNGCPSDRDNDDVLDSDDLCPDVSQSIRPDPNRLGCPIGDSDNDLVLDDRDQCPQVPMGTEPDELRPGCPAKDTDADGIVDTRDLCPNEPQGNNPDPNRLGCPITDRDGDTVNDPDDACPDTAGAPSTDPKKNGCPGLVTRRNGMLEIMQPLFFATGKDVILKKSDAVLYAVADALKAQPEIKKIAIEGHTDSKGSEKRNMDLSERRARSVMQRLIANGVEAERLEAHGFGPTRPIASNKTPRGRAENRRVEFRILDPADGGAQSAPAAPSNGSPLVPTTVTPSR